MRYAAVLIAGVLLVGCLTGCEITEEDKEKVKSTVNSGIDYAVDKTNEGLDVLEEKWENGEIQSAAGEVLRSAADAIEKAK